MNVDILREFANPLMNSSVLIHIWVMLFQDTGEEEELLNSSEINSKRMKIRKYIFECSWKGKNVYLLNDTGEGSCLSFHQITVLSGLFSFKQRGQRQEREGGKVACMIDFFQIFEELSHGKWILFIRLSPREFATRT